MVKMDVPCTNGVIHVISSILLPPTLVPHSVREPGKKYFESTILDIYKNILTLQEALGLDPLLEGYDVGALARLN